MHTVMCGPLSTARDYHSSFTTLWLRRQCMSLLCCIVFKLVNGTGVGALRMNVVYA